MTLDQLLRQNEIGTRETSPDCPSISQTWYVARDVVQALGHHWSGSKTLHFVPEHHKAMLMGTGTDRHKNAWCLSPTGVTRVIEHFAQQGAKTAATQSTREGVTARDPSGSPTESAALQRQNRICTPGAVVGSIWGYWTGAEGAFPTNQTGDRA